MPAIVRTSVDLPAPFAPMIPTTEPRGTSSDTPRTALISRITRWRRPMRTIALLNVGRFSSDVRYVTDTSSTRIAVGAATLVPLETDSEITLPRHEEETAADE